MRFMSKLWLSIFLSYGANKITFFFCPCIFNARNSQGKPRQREKKLPSQSSGVGRLVQVEINGCETIKLTLAALREVGKLFLLLFYAFVRSFVSSAIRFPSGISLHTNSEISQNQFSSTKTISIHLFYA